MTEAVQTCGGSVITRESLRGGSGALEALDRYRNEWEGFRADRCHGVREVMWFRGLQGELRGSHQVR
jgi:hypothetical protein